MQMITTETCGQVIDDGQRVCASAVTDEVSWLGPAGSMDITIGEDGRYEYHYHRAPVAVRVCSGCADWLTGLGGQHLNPTRRQI